MAAQFAEVVVPARRHGHATQARVRFGADDVCRVAVEVASTTWEAAAADFVTALAEVGRRLDQDAVLLACNGARRNVRPSGMLVQATRGRRAYGLAPRAPGAPPEQRPETVDIFDAAGWDDIVTVAEQDAWYAAWLGARRRPGPPRRSCHWGRLPPTCTLTGTDVAAAEEPRTPSTVRVRLRQRAVRMGDLALRGRNSEGKQPPRASARR
jgi:hypothetical protein